MMMMASLTDSEEIKGKGKGQGFCGGKEKKKRKEEASGTISLEASLNTQKGNDIGEIPILPLCSITGYYILPSLQKFVLEFYNQKEKKK